MIEFNIRDVSFAKKQIGEKIVTELSFAIPENLKKLILAGQVGEIFDVTGLIGPIVTHMKLDLHKITILHLSWEDGIPNEF